MRARALLLAALPAACAQEAPPHAQIVFYVTTDAPLPPAPGETAAALDPAPLFDELRIDVAAPPGTDAPCSDCSRTFVVDRAMVEAGKASIGIVPARMVAGYSARARLFRSASAYGGEPDPNSTLDTTVVLPALDGDRVTELTLVLHTDDVATHLGAETAIAPDAGRPRPSLVGSWHGAQRTRCTGDPRPGEVCVPGGAYWMGNTRLRDKAPLVTRSQLSEGGDVERIVVLAPFFLSQAEVTVAAYRASGLFVPAGLGDPVLSSNQPACTFSSSPGPNDALPVNCVSYNAARRYCQKLGGDLPTEAEFEYANSGLRGSSYVWGDEDPQCGDAAYGRNGRDCGAILSLPRQAGSGLRDRLTPPEAAAEIVDLAGNLGEWSADVYDTQVSACWGTGVHENPLCTSSATPAYRSVRGGSWLVDAVSLMAAFRNGVPATQVDSGIGFRCARPGAP